MNNQKGNGIIVIMVVCIFIFTGYLISLKMKQQQLPQSDTKSQLNQFVESAKQSIPNSIGLDRSNAQQLSHPTHTEKPKQKKTIKPIIESEKNIVTTLPNGFAFPKESGLINSYPIRFNNGNVGIILDNTHSKSNLLIFLYHLRELNTNTDTNTPMLSSVALLNSGDELTLKMKSGYYQLKWLVLSNNRAYETKEFMLHQDNKLAYDVLFSFKKQDTTKITDTEINPKELN